MANTIVPWERLLYVAYLPPYVYEDGTHDGQAIVIALFEVPAVASSKGYAIREYSLKKGEMFYRFPKQGGHWRNGTGRPRPRYRTQSSMMCAESLLVLPPTIRKPA
jgi:hypothetical protein